MSQVLSVQTDKPDYCKYELGLSVITVRGTCDTPGAPVTVALARTDPYGTLATVTVNAAGGTAPASFIATFDLNSAAMNDTDGINRAVQGDYTVTATLGSSSLSTTLTVSLVSLQEMHRRWLYGATLYASEIVLPKLQPQTMPVTIMEVSPFFYKGAFPLVYTYAGYQLSFAGGPNVTLVPNTGLQQFILLDSRQADWVRVQVDTSLLPQANATETIVLDQAQMTEQDILMYMRQATAWVENKLGFAVEPHLYTSGKLYNTGKYPQTEKISQGAGFYGTFNTQPIFPNIVLPLQWLLSIKALEGWYNQQAVLQIPSVWWQRSEQEGNIELVPTSGQASSIVWLSFPMSFAAQNYQAIPDFWQYSVVAGLRDLAQERAIVREAIAKKAAIETLLVAGAAYRAGISSRSTSRDNVSFSETYTASAMYGIYSHLTVPYGEWLDKLLPTIRRRLGGIVMTTLQ